MAFEEIGNTEAGGVFDEVIEIDKTPGELAGEMSANSGFAGSHEAGEGDDGTCGSAGHEGILVE